MATISYTNRHAATTERIDGVPGRDLLGQVLDAGAPIGYICMAGSCGTCKVQVTAGMAGLSQPSRAEQFHCKQPGQRLACQAVFLDTEDVTCEQ